METERTLLRINIYFRILLASFFVMLFYTVNISVFIFQYENFVMNLFVLASITGIVLCYIAIINYNKLKFNRIAILFIISGVLWMLTMSIVRVSIGFTVIIISFLFRNSLKEILERNSNYCQSYKAYDISFYSLLAFFIYILIINNSVHDNGLKFVCFGLSICVIINLLGYYLKNLFILNYIRLVIVFLFLFSSVYLILFQGSELGVYLRYSISIGLQFALIILCFTPLYSIFSIRILNEICNIKLVEIYDHQQIGIIATESKYPAYRALAIKKLDLNQSQDILIKIAKNDKKWLLRKAAIEKFDISQQIQLLNEIVKTCKNFTICQNAHKLLHSLTNITQEPFKGSN